MVWTRFNHDSSGNSDEAVGLLADPLGYDSGS
jgi:hypothetical protein